jgi:hypothetical protein
MIQSEIFHSIHLCISLLDQSLTSGYNLQSSSESMVALGAPHQKQQGAGALIETLESARYYSSDSEYGEDKVFKNAATKKTIYSECGTDEGGFATSLPDPPMP